MHGLITIYLKKRMNMFEDNCEMERIEESFNLTMPKGKVADQSVSNDFYINTLTGTSVPLRQIADFTTGGGGLRFKVGPGSTSGPT
jgi:hypothetical protein